jgi:hypothetical protein
VKNFIGLAREGGIGCDSQQKNSNYSVHDVKLSLRPFIDITVMMKFAQWLNESENNLVCLTAWDNHGNLSFIDGGQPVKYFVYDFGWAFRWIEKLDRLLKKVKTKNSPDYQRACSEFLAAVKKNGIQEQPKQQKPPEGPWKQGTLF